MSNPFSSKGTIGRLSFLGYCVLLPLTIPLAALTCLIVLLLSSPLGAPATGYFWSEASAAFVERYLGWMHSRWGLVLVVAVFYLVGQRLFDCAYVKRARAIGVEIRNTWFVQLYVLGFEQGATMKDLLLTAGHPHTNSRVDGQER